MRIFVAVLIWVFGMGAGFAQALPEAVAKRLQKDPSRYQDFASGVILGYGGAKGIDRAGILRFVALRRAEARAAALRRLQAADLDFDGAIRRDEISQVAAAASAPARGRLWKVFELADSDANDSISAVELEAYGRGEAMRRMSQADEDEALAILAFDDDGDGWVGVKDLAAAMAAMVPKAENEGGLPLTKTRGKPIMP
jgi:Ca2+-binding EF-hand superfamily protein